MIVYLWNYFYNILNHQSHDFFVFSTIFCYYAIRFFYRLPSKGFHNVNYVLIISLMRERERDSDIKI